MSTEKNELDPERFDTLPGSYIRHLQQISVAIFLRETRDFGITPAQFVTLRFVAANQNIDQRTLAGAVGLDASTTTGVIDRLEARKLLERKASATDRRVKHLRVTPAGTSLLKQMLPAVLHAQRQMLEPLAQHERKEFVRMLSVLVVGNNELSRAPKNELHGTKLKD